MISATCFEFYPHLFLHSRHNIPHHFSSLKHHPPSVSTQITIYACEIMILCMKLLRACVLAVLSPLILAIYGIVILHSPFFHNVHDSLGFHPFSSHTFAGYFSPYAPSDPHLTPLRRHHACRRVAVSWKPVLEVLGAFSQRINGNWNWSMENIDQWSPI